MFYSQFILAKKGPLGTIWIAAHLERKLRKNQVADTDIGVSVDSIICPEVPIALRLSSHLLVGVVRIYSRKVNYLFHDCSEALLKIKQAFRSTAVDLPPEESTAPYHAITLPETFDLDGFELPDAVLQGNFVDHHVSSREQITLQDKVENTAYTSMQFGLDERFGDGDTSQIHLNLAEELFLKKDVSLNNSSIRSENLENQLSGPPETPFTPYVNMDVDDYQEDHEENRTVEDSTNIPAYYGHNFGQHGLSFDRMVSGGSSNLQGYNIKTPDLNELIFPRENVSGADLVQNYTDTSFPANGILSTDLLGPAQAPSTPGLLEEVVPAHLQDATLSHQEKSSPSNYAEDAIPNRMQLEPECHPEPECHNLVNTIGNPSLSQCSTLPASGSVEVLGKDCEKSCEYLTNKGLQDDGANKTHGDVHALDMMTLDVYNVKGSEEELVQDVESTLPASSLSIPVDKNIIGQGETNHSLHVDCPELADVSQTKPAAVMHFLHNGLMVAPDLGCPLQPCASNNHTNGTFSDDQIFVGIGNNQQFIVENHAGRSMPGDGGLSLDVQDGGLCTSFLDGGPEVIQMAGNAPCINTHSAGSGFPEPERVMLAPMSMHSYPNYTQHYISGGRMLELDASAQMHSSSFGVEHYPESGGMMLASTSSQGLPKDVEQSFVGNNVLETGGSHIYHSLSSKELSFGESTSAFINDSSAKLPGLPRSKRKASYIPDDNDLLASILVGKRTSSCKTKQSPPLLPSSKRPRLTPKPCALKRKALIDDIMVLHADTIRQQLMSTDDIRRMRKKAPCTRLEMWMIQKCSLEDEMFSESVLTGISPMLASFQHQMFDRNGNIYPRLDAYPSPLDLSKMNAPKESVSTYRDSVESDGFANAHPRDNALELPVSSTTYLTTEKPQEPHHFPLPNGAENLVIDAQETAQRNFTGDAAACSTIPREAHNTSGGGDNSERADVAADGYPCSINEPLNNDNDQEAPSMTISDGVILNTSHESPVQSVHPYVKNDYPAPVENTCSVGYELHGFENQCVTNETTNDAKASTVIVTEEQCLCSLGSFGDTGMTDKVPAETAYNSDGGLNMSENTSVVIDEMQQTCAANENEVETQKKQADTSADDKDISLGEKSEYITCSDTIILTSGVDQESNRESDKPVEIVEDAGASKDSFDQSAVDENDNDTEFLNIGDEIDFDEEVDYDVPNPAEAESLENSGWSTRTRGVARYLKLLFDEETGYGRKDVQLDRLLSGKGTKEASRMFFETLVLKTKDHIHVEQEKAYGSITIEPRSALLKTTF